LPQANCYLIEQNREPIFPPFPSATLRRPDQKFKQAARAGIPPLQRIQTPTSSGKQIMPE